MTELEMQIEFDRLVELQSKELGSIEKPASQTVARFLTNAQLRYLSDTYLQGGSQDIIRNRVNEIPQLVKREVVDTTEDTTGPYGTTGNSYHFDTDDLTSYTFMFYIRSDSLVKRTNPPKYAHGSTSRWVQNKLIDYSEIDKVLTTAYNLPILLEPRVIIEENDADDTGNHTSRLIILTDSYTTLNSGTDQTSTLHLTYLKEPSDIAINSDSGTHTPESPVHLHQKIVEMAVQSYIYYEYSLQAKLEKPGENSQ